MVQVKIIKNDKTTIVIKLTFNPKKTSFYNLMSRATETVRDELGKYYDSDNSEFYSSEEEEYIEKEESDIII